MRQAAAGKWQGQSRNKQVRGQSPTRVERVPLTICSFVRHNLSYYDYNQIKWAKTVHYLLENYRIAANIRTKDVLLCSKERELLRSFYQPKEVALKVSALTVQPSPAPLLFIDSHCHLLMLRKRQHRQLEQAKLQRHLNTKNSQKSLPFMLNCRTDTHQGSGSGSDTRKSRVLNFDALIGSSGDFTRRSDRLLAPIQQMLLLPYEEEYRKHHGHERRETPTKRKGSMKKPIVQQRVPTRPSQNPYLLQPANYKPRRQKKAQKPKKLSIPSKPQRSAGSCGTSQIQEYSAAAPKKQLGMASQLPSEDKQKPGHRYTRSEGRLK